MQNVIHWLQSISRHPEWVDLSSGCLTSRGQIERPTAPARGCSSSSEAGNQYTAQAHSRHRCLGRSRRRHNAQADRGYAGWAQACYSCFHLGSPLRSTWVGEKTPFFCLILAPSQEPHIRQSFRLIVSRFRTCLSIPGLVTTQSRCAPWDLQRLRNHWHLTRGRPKGCVAMNKVVVVNTEESQSCSKNTPELSFSAVTPEMLEEFLVDVAKENENNLLNLSQHAGCFKKTTLIEFVFLLCEQLGLHQVTGYQAVELLERFMIRYIEKLYSSTCTGSDKSTEKLGWEQLQDIIQEHFVLRIMSCVQIASKISFHYQIVNISMALKVFQSLGCSYKKEDFLESELLVLETLNFQVNVPSPFTHTEVLLEVM
ncbi:hypothetical protein chiPu_0023002, partial [Chiloscyllium punctatum]|nr:hypothetical protein [Chiloscyllium punctatum]